MIIESRTGEAYRMRCKLAGEVRDWTEKMASNLQGRFPTLPDASQGIEIRQSSIEPFFRMVLRPNGAIEWVDPITYSADDYISLEDYLSSETMRAVERGVNEYRGEQVKSRRTILRQPFSRFFPN